MPICRKYGNKTKRTLAVEDINLLKGLQIKIVAKKRRLLTSSRITNPRSQTTIKPYLELYPTIIERLNVGFDIAGVYNELCTERFSSKCLYNYLSAFTKTIISTPQGQEYNLKGNISHLFGIMLMNKLLQTANIEDITQTKAVWLKLREFLLMLPSALLLCQESLD